MKTYEEMRDNVFRRIYEYETEKKRKRNIYIKTAAAAAPMCAAGAAVFALWIGGVAEPKIPVNDIPVTNSRDNSEKYTVTYARDAVSESITSETSSATENTQPTVTVNSYSSTVPTENDTQEESTALQESTVAYSETAPTAPLTEPLTQNVTAAQTGNGSGSMPPNAGDFMAWVRINGEFYTQLPEYNGKTDIFTKGSYVGKASEFESLYTEGWIDCDSNIYTVEGKDDLLIMEYIAPATGTILLQKVEPVTP
jgi:hypothetical protein